MNNNCSWVSYACFLFDMSPSFTYAPIVCLAPDLPLVTPTSSNSAGTLPPSFTKPFRSHHHHHRHQPHHAPPLFNTSRPRATLASAAVSEAAAPQTLQAANSLATLGGGVGSLLSPQNNALHTNIFSSVRRSNNLPRKRPRISSHPYGRPNNDFINEIPDLRLGSPAPAGVSPIRAGKRNGNTSGDGGSLWGLGGVSPTGVIDPRTSAEPLETEWACPTSSVATSTSSLRDGFSDVSKSRPSLLFLGRGTRTYRACTCCRAWHWRPC